MSIPAIPSGFIIQQGDAKVFVSWDLIPGATSYSVERSEDGVTYAVVDSPVVNYFLDDTVTVNTNYYYQVASVNSDGTSSFTSPLQAIPTLPGQLSLGEIRQRAKEAADRTNSNFLTVPEWNFNINQSYFELYDLLITVYEDYYVSPRLTFQTDGTNSLYALPNGQNYSAAPAMYKLFGVDLGLDSSTDAWVTLKKFDFISRNRYVYPQITTTLLGVFNLQYRVIGSNIMFIPTPSSGQTVGLWYYPRLTWLLQDTDVMDGISGWTEYVIVDAAIKALRKEESDVSVLMAQKMALIDRINSTATNRDAGQGDTISDVRTWGERWGRANGDGPDGGF